MRVSAPLHSPPGTLEYDPDADRLRCTVCGNWYRNLAQHARLTHGLSAADYRELAGLNRTTALMAPGLRDHQRTVQAPRLRRLHAEGRIVTWADDPAWFAEVKSQAVQALRDGLRPEARQRRRALWDEARRARQGAWRRARNLAGERATPEQIAAGIRRGTITCERCGAVVPRTGTRQRLCPDCRREHERAYQREWKQRKRTRGALRGAARTA